MRKIIIALAAMYALPSCAQNCPQCIPPILFDSPIAQKHKRCHRGESALYSNGKLICINRDALRILQALPSDW